MQENPRTLRILQYNVRKSYGQVMAPLFNQKMIDSFDIIALQEPWRNTHQNTTYHPRKDVYELSYMDHGRTRVCWYINKRLSLVSWTVANHSPDLSTMCLQTKDNCTLYIHNIYNPTAGSGEPSGIPLLENVLASNLSNEQIILGDFNLHHASWGGPNCHNDPLSSNLLVLAEQYQLSQLVPDETTTYAEGNGQSTIDLFFPTKLLAESLIKCKIDMQLDNHSDHMPIVTVINLKTHQSTPSRQYNWKKVDLRKLKEFLQQEINQDTCLNNTAASAPIGSTGATMEIDN